VTPTPSARLRRLARRRKDKRGGVDLISDALPFGRLWYGEPNAITNAIGHAKHRSRPHDAVIRVYDAVGDVIETHEHAGGSRNRDTALYASQCNVIECRSCSPVIKNIAIHGRFSPWL
jgi:hypothetical protein